MSNYIKNSNLIEIDKKITLNKLIKKIDIKNNNINDIINLYNIKYNDIIDSNILIDILDKFNYFIIENFNYSINKIYITYKYSLNLLRSSIVTLIGHVDSGKTSILDIIQNSNFVDNEVGKITQYIRSFKINNNNNNIIFIDTPGHESFINIRRNCIKISDILIFVISVDDLLKNNIINKFINEINSLNLSIKLIIVINKIDKINNIIDINNMLNNYLYKFIEIDKKYEILYLSAKKNKNIEKILDSIRNKSNMINLKFNNNNIAYGVVIESSLDKNIGFFAKIIIKDGIINIGDLLLFNYFFCKIRLIIDENNIKLKKANPSNIVKIFGLSKIPKIGEKVIILNDIKKAKNIILYRNIIKNKNKINNYICKYDNLNINNDKIYKLNYIIKTNSTGINDAILNSINEISINKNININIINIEVGNINNNDVYLASSSNSELLNFNTKIDNKLIKLINKLKIKYNFYLIIYDLINYIKYSINNIILLEKENDIEGCAYVLNIFNINNVNIIGCKLHNGFFNKSNKIKILRNNLLLYSGLILSMKNFNKYVDEVNNNIEFGITISNKNVLIKKGDKILSFKNIK